MISSLRNRIAKSKTSKETTPNKTKTNRYKKNTSRLTSNKENAAAAESLIEQIDQQESEKLINLKQLNKEINKNMFPTNNVNTNAPSTSKNLMNNFTKLKIDKETIASPIQQQQSQFVTNKLVEPMVKESEEIADRGRFADECEYRMNHSRRGVALIINNKRFEPRLEMPTREGTDRDAACLETTLTKLGFDIKLVHNCSASLMREQILKLARADHSDMDCFVCVIMSHGEEGTIYGVDKPIELDQLINPFKLNRTLAGKPKMFFIQACRGSNFMEGIDSNPFEIQYVNKIPMEADFLIAYSTIAGYFSWRNSVKGSWFIQSLCEVLSEYGKSLEIMQMLTMVNRKVAYNYESCTNDQAANGKKQIPCIVSMLTKELYFKNKTIYSIQT